MIVDEMNAPVLRPLYSFTGEDTKLGLLNDLSI